ncbi:MAG: type II toxin-antitoxin system HigB family toxin [Candidatus Saccharimonadia bacterium]
MRLANRQLLRDFALQHIDAKTQLDTWEDNIKDMQWKTPHELKQSYPKASIIDGANVVFNIIRNRYRIWVKVNYTAGIVLIKKIGTHREYDKWDIK